jgi:hypothetical protein
MRSLKVRSVLAGALVLTGCALLPGGANPEDLAEAVPRHLTMEVDNQNYYDATLYGHYAGERRRLGQVGGLNRGEFDFTWTAPEILVEIKLVAVGSYYLRRITVDPGDELKVIVQPNLHTYRPGTVF